MNVHRNCRTRLAGLLIMSLAVAGTLFAQDSPSAPQQASPAAPDAGNAKKTLVVNGKPLGATILQIDGRSYVDIQTLVENTNGSVSFEADRILVTIPTPARTVVAGANSASPAAAQGIAAGPGQPGVELSRGFASSANVTLANVREWQGTLSTLVTYGLAAGGVWAQNYHDRVITSLAQTTAAVANDADHAVLAMLNAEVGNLEKWSADLFAERQALNAARTIDPNSLRNDPVLAKITNCGNFLGGMIVSGVYQDDASCH